MTNRPTDRFGGAIPLALFAAAAAGLGFLRSFFSDPGSLDGWHLVHGIASCGWIALVLTQAGLIRTRNYRLHRLLGWCSLGLFAVLMVTSLRMVAAMLAGTSGMPFGLAKLLGWADLVTLPLFALLYGLALVLRRDRHLHSRLIAGTLLIGIIPSAGRVFAQYVPFFGGLAGALPATYWLVLALLVLCMVSDWRRGRLRWPFPFMFGWFALTLLSLTMVSGSSWFDGVARALAG